MQQETGLVRAELETFMPAATVEAALARRNAVIDFVKRVMEPGKDYGVIPGTEKPTLLKPGAEKLCSLFGLTPEFTALKEIEDWTGAEHGGEPLFYYKYRCRLARHGIVLGEGDGSCNSWEIKYRYREAARECPKCAQTSIAKSKEEYGGGWYCNRKRGGCGARFAADDPAIVDQQIGRIPNPDVADQVNTVLKMALKRALIAAILIAANASDLFRAEEDPEGGRGKPGPKKKPKPQEGDGQASSAPLAAAGDERSPAGNSVPAEVEAIWKRIVDIDSTVHEFHALRDQLLTAMGPGGETEYRRCLADAKVTHSNEFKGNPQLARQTIFRLWKILRTALELRRPVGEQKNGQFVVDKAAK